MATATRTPTLRLACRPGRVPAIDGAGFALGAVMLASARAVPQLVSPLAFWMLLAALAAAFGADYLAWYLRGPRTIELDEDTLTLRRGRSRPVQRIPRASVIHVRSRRRWGGRSIVIGLRPRGGVLLRDDAFDRRAFAVLAERLSAWKG